MAYSQKFKKRVLKHVKIGITPIEVIAKIRKVPKQTIYRWLNKYKKYGNVGLQNRKSGAKKRQINIPFVKFMLAKRGVESGIYS